MRTPGRVALALAAIALVAGCGSTPTAGPAASPPPPAVVPAPVADPVSVSIPSIGVASPPLVALGLNPDRTVQVPSLKTPQVAGWYTGAARPGEAGPAVLLGHVDSHGTRGVFYRLRDVKVGDQVLVGRADGSTITFVVTKTKTVPKAAFNTTEVYGPTPGPTLRLITCGGPLDAAAHNYLDSIEVFADPAT